MSFREICIFLWKSRWRLLSATVIGAALGLAISVVSRPLYKAEVLLAPVDRQSSGLQGLAGQLGGLASLTGIQFSGLGNSDGIPLAMLTSRALISHVIEERQLLPVLFSDRWDTAANRWKAGGKKRPPTLWEAERLFSREVLRVREDRATGLISVEILWRDPGTSADWANELVSRADAMLRARAVETAEGNISFLEKQLDATSIVEIRQSVYRLIEEQLKELMLARGGSEYAYRVLDPATVPERKVGPSAAVLMAAGALVALLIVLSGCIALASCAANSSK